MTTGADILPGHAGTCHRAAAFADPELERIVRRVERDYAQRFLDHKMIMRVVPIEIDFRAPIPRGRRRGLGRRTKQHLGEGVAVRLDAIAGHAGDQATWLTEAAADMVVRQRPASRSEWTQLRSHAEVEELLRAQADRYLRELAPTRV